MWVFVTIDSPAEGPAQGHSKRPSAGEWKSCIRADAGKVAQCAYLRPGDRLQKTTMLAVPYSPGGSGRAQMRKGYHVCQGSYCQCSALLHLGISP